MPPKANQSKSKRDDFRQSTKSKLAGRVNYACSNPDCQTPTLGPSDDSVSGLARSGDAAHITAASPGGPRYDEKLTREERRAPANGIWLCKKHASLIDSDHSRYSVPLLSAWKSRAEELARIAQGGSADHETDHLFTHAAALTTPDDETAAKKQIDTWVRHFFADVGAKRVFTSDDRKLSENFAYEMALNAHRHEGIRTFRFRSQKTGVAVEYVSTSGYGLSELMSSPTPRGGVAAVELIKELTQGRLSINFQSIDGINRWILTVLKLGMSDDPCSVNLNEKTETQLAIFRSGCEGCAEVHVHGHLNDHTSDNFVTARYVQSLVDDGHKVVVHSASGPLARHLEKTIKKNLRGQGTFELSEHPQ